jgi:hypothetical protein
MYGEGIGNLTVLSNSKPLIWDTPSHGSKEVLPVITQNCHWEGEVIVHCRVHVLHVEPGHGEDETKTN